MMVGRVYYSGPEPGMVPASLADFECQHGIIGDCRHCSRIENKKVRHCALCGEPATKKGKYCTGHSWADEA